MSMGRRRSGNGHPLLKLLQRVEVLLGYLLFFTVGEDADISLNFLSEKEAVFLVRACILDKTQLSVWNGMRTYNCT